MNMKKHILTALKEQFDGWEELLKGMNEEQVNAPLLPWNWSCKDGMAHLWAWQLRSIARLEAALFDREPDYPRWSPELEPITDENLDQVNDWIYQANRDLPWLKVYQSWREGFVRFLEAGEKIPERDLLDSGRYKWMEGHPLANTLLASYDHHQEHYDKLIEWMEEHKAE
jgi:hypothetical protein